MANNMTILKKIFSLLQNVFIIITLVCPAIILGIFFLMYFITILLGGNPSIAPDGDGL